MEALIGALFLDAGFNTTQTYINEWWQPLLENIHLNTEQDSKSALQVWTQKHYGTKPTYTLLTQTGPAHAPRIEIEVKIDKKDGQPPTCLKVTHASRRLAEKEAATLILSQLHKDS